MTSEPKFSPTLQVSTAQRIVTWARHAQARDLVARAARALGAEARVMPLKGVLLAAIEAVHPAERPIRDADVLVSGVGLTGAVRRLGRAGFKLVDVPWSYGYVSLAHDQHPTLWLDLHVVLMPIGLGRLTPDYMFARARPDTRLFGATVHVPSSVALMVQLLANVVKDRIVLAFDHVPGDLAAVARSLSGPEPSIVVADLKALGLAHGGSLALAWAHRRVPEPRFEELLRGLVPRAPQRAAIDTELSTLEAGDQGALWARMRARGGADSLWLQALATAFTAASVVTHPARKAWLLANNRGDAA